MNGDLLSRLARLLDGADRPPAPAPPPPSGASVGEDPAACFGREIGRATGRLVRVRGAAVARAWIEDAYPECRVVFEDEQPGEADLRAAEVGVDTADLLVAETGTVVRTYPSRESSRISLVPAVSVFLARGDALVRDLPAALARLAPAHRDGRAYTVFVTGPSRTADIEKQLVIPAHGPRELVVLLLGEG
ncbi:MAG: LUD domain-containing protein [Planctomycetota bacterium]